MGTLIFAAGVIVEVAFTVLCVVTRSNQTRARSIIRITALVGLVLLAALHLITWSLRYYSLAALLSVLALMGAITLWRGKPEKGSFGVARVIARAVGMTALVFAAALPAIVFPEYKAIAPTGTYQVATVTYTYTDTNRVETYARASENRKLNVQLWYPKDAGGTYPLVVFSHGSLGVKSSNLSLYNELASHGYVVCSIDHTYQCLYTTDVSHHTTLFDMGFVREVGSDDPELDPERSYGLYRKWMTVRTGDIDFVIDHILAEARRDTSDPVYRLVDPSRIGAIGHSLGGSAALGVGRTRGDVKAVVSLEAPFMCDIRGVQDGKLVFTDEVYPVPVLNIYSDDSWGNLADWPQYAENYALLSDARPDVFNVHIAGSGHLTLTDLALTSPLLARMPVEGRRPTIDAEYCLRTIDKLCLEFFDCYLKGQGRFTAGGTY